LSNDSQYLSSFLLASNPTILVILLWLATFFSDPRFFHVKPIQPIIGLAPMGGPTFKVLNLAIHLPPLSSLPSSLSLLSPDPIMSSSLATLIFLPLFPTI